MRGNAGVALRHFDIGPGVQQLRLSARAARADGRRRRDALTEHQHIMRQLTRQKARDGEPRGDGTVARVQTPELVATTFSRATGAIERSKFSADWTCFREQPADWSTGLFPVSIRAIHQFGG